MSKILVIDDDLNIFGAINSLATRLGVESSCAPTLGDGLRKLERGDYDLVFLDVRLPDGNGLDALPRIKETASAPEVIILTGVGDPDGAELAIQNGVWDYLVKPSSIKSLSFSLKRALQYRQEKRNHGPVALHRDSIIGVSPQISRRLDLVAQAARSKASALITGETGTGKELFARTIHNNSDRADRPFVTVDCASLPENLIESILFGHKRGAFTGADRDKVGLVKLADGGTLFLDEVGELPLAAQRSFLRVLQERRFRPVGGSEEVTSDFRLIAATNRDLEKMAEEGSFRSDLLFRLKTMHIHLPPLRERIEDVKPLALHFVDKLCDEYGMTTKGFDQAFWSVLKAYSWPGNIRELSNVLERAVVASGREKTLYPMHLPADIRIRVARKSFDGAGDSFERDESSEIPDAAGGASFFVEPEPPRGAPHVPSPRFVGEMQAMGALDAPEGQLTLKQFKNEAERVYLRRLLDSEAGNVEKILEVSDLSRSHFYALLKKYGLST